MARKVTILLIVVLLVMPFQVFASGGEEKLTGSDQEVIDGGVTPDSFIYFFDKLAEEIRLKLTFSSAKKAELLLNIAKERLAESSKMVEVSKTDLSEETLKEYHQNLEKAVKSTSEAVEKGEEVANVTVKIYEETKNKKEITKKILSNLKGHSKNKIKEELDEVYENVEASKDVAVLVEKKKENEGQKTVEDKVVNVVVESKVGEQSILEKIKSENLNPKQIVAIVSLAEQSGKSLDEVLNEFLKNGKVIESTAIALKLDPNEALKGINKSFKEYRKSIKKIVKRLMKNMYNEIENLDKKSKEQKQSTFQRLQKVRTGVNTLLNEMKQKAIKNNNDKITEEITELQKEMKKEERKVIEKIIEKKEKELKEAIKENQNNKDRNVKIKELKEDFKKLKEELKNNQDMQ